MNEPASSPSSTQPCESTTEQGGRAEAIHDFTGKLLQPSMWPAVVDYIEWQRARRRARAAGEGEPEIPDRAPLSINLDLTTACNYACDHCIDWDILNSKVRHSDDALRSSIAGMTLRGLKSVILIGGGEPTLYPGFADFVAFVKRLGLQVAVVSNGSRGDRLLHAVGHLRKGDWIRLSLDSGSNEVFRRMHKPSSKTLDLDEICSWVPKLKAANPDFDMGFSFVITWQGSKRSDHVAVVENLGEIESAARRAKASAFDYISYKPFLVRSEDGSEVMDPEQTEQELDEVRRRIRAGIDAALRLEGDGFRVMESTNLRLLLQGSWEEFTRQPRMCHMQALRQVVTPLGVYNCPAHRGVEKALVGPKDAYADQDAVARTQEATRDILDRFDASTECAEVTCLYNGVNWWLDEQIGSDEPLPVAGDERGDWFL